MIDLLLTICCQKGSHHGIIRGHAEDMLNNISGMTGADMERFLGTWRLPGNL